MKLLQIITLLVLAGAIGIRVIDFLSSQQTETFTISGNVIDERSGNPLAGVKVTVTDSNSLSMTKESGLYKIPCSTGTHKLRFLLEGYENHDEIIAVNGGNLTVNVVLKPEGLPPQPTQSQTATITGKITNAKTGTPISGAAVGTKNRRAITGSEGDYSMNIDVGTYNIAASAKGYESNTVSVNIAEKEKYTVDIALSPVPFMRVTASPDLIYTRETNRESTITAVVMKEDGTPAVGIQVSFMVREDSDVIGKLDSQTVVTNEKGVAKVVWTCEGETKVEELNVINASRLSYWTRIVASCTIEGTSLTDTNSLVVQKEACHRSC